MLASDDYQQIAHMTAIKIVGLIREGWLSPLTIHMTGADDEHILSGSCDENGKIQGHDPDAQLLNPNAKFPVTVSISDQNGRTLLLEISEHFSVN